MENKRTAVIDMSKWVTGEITAGRVPTKLNGVLDKVRPMFREWMVADSTFQKNTKAVAALVRRAWELYEETINEGRVGFARLFDPTIPEGSKTRDLTDNATYNRLNYLIDQVGKPVVPGQEDEPSQRVPISEKRKKMHADWVSFKRRHKAKPATLAEVEELLKHVLAEIWAEEAVEEVVAA